MNDHTYVATDMHHAMKLVKEDIGADAVILSHRNVMEGVEIVAAPAEMMNMLQQQIANQPSVAQAPTDSMMAPTAANPMSQTAVAANGAVNDAANGEVNRATNTAAAQVPAELGQNPKPAGRARSFSFPGLSKRSFSNKVRAEGVDAGLNMASTAQNVGQSELDDVQVSLSNVGQARVGNNPQPNMGQSTNAMQGRVNASTVRPARRPGVAQASELDRTVEHLIEKNSSEMSAMRDELNSLKALLEAQFKAMSWTQYSQQNPVQASIWKRLERIGLAEFLRSDLVSNIDGDMPLKSAWNEAGESLKQILPIFQDNLCDYHGIISLVGPTGAGKTTTIGKIAAHHVLKYGTDEVALVSTDSFRIASKEQLNSYGRILGIPVYSVSANQTLDQILESVGKRRLVLIDNPGLSGDEALFDQHLDPLAESRFPIDNFFVMPCTSQHQVLESYLGRLDGVALQGSIVTKVDEALQIGHVLSIAIGSELPIANYTNGQNIPDDIRQATAGRLVNLAVDIAKNSMPSSQSAHIGETKSAVKQEKSARMDLNDY